ncbi:esterase/lipase superfamily enzyme [Pacificibacter maritimus]|uniref:Esterase/lipase superfamily enzyme n=1 Tax=Pacificibacter maritimus TaxID=762213 RepID=A0A3N4UM19_9RHOB|nr:alpha/beta fold hydrolase [Pacificibacter maritimus]RPE71048.1 esterase/lipase superfamily enzyme [Pacificibacter maritimus]
MTHLSRRSVTLGLLATGTAGLSACAPQPKLLSAPFSGTPVTRKVMAVTNRTVSPDTLQQFQDGRASELSYLSYDISIPSNRTLGSFSFPKRSLDPEREFYVARTDKFEGPQPFISHLNSELRGSTDPDGNLLVFVHGYNVSYAASVFRAAQIATDFELDMPVVLFGWPSSARISGYAYDRDSVLFARADLANTLATLARSQARKITILAHSMGGFLAMEALKRLTLEQDTRTLSRIDGVVLAQPDIDTDVFRAQMADVDLDRQFVAVMASGRDRALKLSTVLTGGHPRVGTTENIEDIRRAGAAVIDVSDVSSRDFLNHDTYASSPALIKMVRSGALMNRVIEGEPGQDLLILGANLTGKAALAIAHLPYTVTGN